MNDAAGAPMSTTHVRAVTEFLDGAGIEHVVHEHEPTYSAAQEARAEHVASSRVAKTVILRRGDAWAMVVVPGSHRVDLHKVRDLLGSTRGLQLASEAEIAERFPQFEVGAVPPVGSVVQAEIIDRRVLDQERVVFAAGDHRHSATVAVDDLVRVTQAKVADICED